MNNIKKLFAAIFSNDNRHCLTERELSVVLRDGREFIATLDGKSIKEILITSKEGENIRFVSFEGCKQRAARLLEAAQTDEWKLVQKLAQSIADWQEDELEVEIFRSNGLKVDRICSMKSHRHSGYINDQNRVIKVISTEMSVERLRKRLKSYKNIREAEKDADRGFYNHAFRDNMVDSSIFRQVQRLLGEKFHLLGGNPEDGVLIASSDPTTGLTVENGQKLAKIILSGGQRLSNPIRFKLVNFPESADGTIGILTKADMKGVCEREALTDSNVLQVRAYSPGKYAMKGLFSIALTRRLEQISCGETVLDIKEFKKMFNIEAKEGDYVDINGIMVLKGDASLGVTDVKLSMQSIERSPLNFRKALMGRVVSEVEKLKREAKEKPQSFLPNFGMFQMLRQMDIPVQGGKDLNSSADKEAGVQLLKFLQKGVRVKGMQLFNLPEKELGFDQILVSKKSAKKLGIDIGDRVTVFAYPLLPSVEEGSATLFSKEVVGFIKGNAMSLSHESCIMALRDYDGDILAITKEVEAPAQSKLDYSCAKGTPQSWFKRPWSGHDGARAFVKLGSDVGLMDYTVSTACKWAEKLNVNLDMLFLGRTVQARIYDKKHGSKPEYSVSAAMQKLSSDIPGAFDARGLLKKHPDLAIKGWKDIPFGTLRKNIKSLLKEKDLTSYMRTILSAFGEIELSPIRTQTAYELREKASLVLEDLMGLVSPEMETLKDDVSMEIKRISIQSFEGIEEKKQLDAKKIMVRRLSNAVKATIGIQSHYLLSLMLLMDDKSHKSILWATVFADIATLNSISNGRVEIVTEKIDKKVTISTEKGYFVATEEADSNATSGWLQVFVRKSDKKNSLKIEDFKDRGIIGVLQNGTIDCGDFVVNIEPSGSTIDPVKGGIYSVKEVLPLLSKKDGSTLSSGLRIFIDCQ